MKNRSKKDTQSSTPILDRTGSVIGIINYRQSLLSPCFAYCRRLLRGLVASFRTRFSQGVTGASAVDSTATGSAGDVRTATDGSVTRVDETGDCCDSSPRTDDPNLDNPILGVDPELLNPERRILQLLLIEGGRLPQATLVERTRWSDSTISRTLCRMETQSRIERHRLGSGKCVVLPQNRET